MNLNSYIGLMGSAWEDDETADGADCSTRPTTARPGDLVVADSGLRADPRRRQQLLRDYCLRLVH